MPGAVAFTVDARALAELEAAQEDVEDPVPPAARHRTISFAVDDRGQSRLNLQTDLSVTGSVYAYSPGRRNNSSLAAAARFKGFSVEGLDGQQKLIRQKWLVEWVHELKNRCAGLVWGGCRQVRTGQTYNGRRTAH